MRDIICDVINCCDTRNINLHPVYDNIMIENQKIENVEIWNQGNFHINLHLKHGSGMEVTLYITFQTTVWKNSLRIYVLLTTATE